MPITKSAVKRARQSAVREDRRRPYKTQMKTLIRKLTDAVKAGNKDEAAKMLPQVYKAIDTAAKKHLIHHKTAAHKKSNMAKMVSIQK